QRRAEATEDDDKPHQDQQPHQVFHATEVYMPAAVSRAGRSARVFAPSLAFTLVALVLAALFVRLGIWQWHRGVSRQEEWTQYARGADQLRALGAQPTSEMPLFQHVSVSGHLDGEHQFLLDNRTHDGRPGYEVLTPLLRESAPTLLVDRGWVPF